METNSTKKTAVMSLYKESRPRVKTVAGISEAFDMSGSTVHHGSALSPLLLITVMEKATKLARGDGQWELLNMLMTWY